MFFTQDLIDRNPRFLLLVGGQDEEDVVESSKNTEDYAELMWLKLVRKTRQRTVATAVHRGYKCDRCAVEPIVGVRWHCRQCRSASSSSDSVTLGSPTSVLTVCRLLSLFLSSFL